MQIGFTGCTCSDGHRHGYIGVWCHMHTSTMCSCICVNFVCIYPVSLPSFAESFHVADLGQSFLALDVHRTTLHSGKAAVLTQRTPNSYL